MNREKAIEILNELLDCSYIDSFDDEEKDALKFAVNALEQKTDNNIEIYQILNEIRGDCIERYSCNGCKFYTKNGCSLKHFPADWMIENPKYNEDSRQGLNLDEFAEAFEYLINLQKKGE